MTRFRMFRIHTNQFAVFKDIFPDSDNLGFQIGLNFKHADNGQKIACAMMFILCDGDERILMLEITCEFEIFEEDWKSFCKDNVVTIPKDTLEFFALHTVGTARGILHCKTEGTSFNGVIMPPINVSEINNSDIVIDMNKKE